MEHDYEVMLTCVRAYLVHVRSTDAMLARMRDDIRDALDALALSGVSYDRQSFNPNAYGDAIPDGIAALEERRARLSQACADYLADYNSAFAMCVCENENRNVCWMRWVEQRPQMDIARRLHYSLSTIRRMERRGVREIYAMMPERWRREPIPNAAPI